MTLIIVESPTKAKTISRFLDKKKYDVLSSYGHVRDLKKKDLGIDIDNNFKPHYIVPDKAKDKIEKLEEKLKKNREVILATDEDREGEAIAWHLDSVLKLHHKAKRIVFHEITETAIKEALKNPRKIDKHMVDAQQARRVLDRIVGFKLSPFLWSKVTMGLSAGRVQSVALRLIAEKEEEVKAFKEQEYWTVEVKLQKYKHKTAKIFSATVESKNGKKIKQFDIASDKDAKKIRKDLHKCEYTVKSVKQSKRKRSPLPPFTTSTLQQSAGTMLGYSPKRTMSLAQNLYEKGLITYHRTDSFNIAKSAIKEVRGYIAKEIGAEYLPEKETFYKNRSKGAQEAHESIRPAFDSRHPFSKRNPDDLKLESAQKRLYTLIWQRFVASQMESSIQLSTTVDIETSSKYILRANGSVIEFDGFAKIYPIKLSENILPKLEEGERLEDKEIITEQHFTQPPARYSEQSLVKALEEHGVGRPSTYASIISVIQERRYVNKNKQNNLEPTDVGILVNDMMVKHFPKIVDTEFTAKMEEQLDEVANGKEKWQEVVGDFYSPFIENLEKKSKSVKKQVQKTDKKCKKCGKKMEKKISKYGWFYACSGYPECKNTESAEEDKKDEKALNIKCDDCGEAMEKKRGKYGVFLGCSGYPECTNIVNLDQDENPMDEPIKDQQHKKCGKCGKEMVQKMGRFGAFLGCSGYPECRNIETILTEANKELEIPDVHCPKCVVGLVKLKTTKRHMYFYGCDKYPSCDFAVWDKPIIETVHTKDEDVKRIVKCRSCKTGVMTEKKGNQHCSNKECKKHKPDKRRARTRKKAKK